jgi:thiol-disulfide isomerase/thioredoxin
MFEQLSNEFDSVQFIKIDIDENEDTAVQYKITSVPTFVFLKGDKVVTQVSRSRTNFFFISSVPLFHAVLWCERRLAENQFTRIKWKETSCR